MKMKLFARLQVITGIAALAGAGLALQAQPLAPFPPSPAAPALAPLPAAPPAVPMTPPAPAVAPFAVGPRSPFALYAQTPPRPAQAPRAPMAPMAPTPPAAPVPPPAMHLMLPGASSLFDDNWKPGGFAYSFGSGNSFGGFGQNYANFGEAYGRAFETLQAPLAALQANVWQLQPQLSLLFEPGQSASANERQRESEDRAREAAQRVREAKERTRDMEMSYSDAYQSGSRALDRRDYERALKYFDKVIEGKGNRADGAMYWKAYTLGKLGKREEALAALTSLQSQFAQSRWVNDAKVLAAELRQSSGQGVSPEKEGDDEIKLLAINSLIQSDPERAVPLLEKLLNDPKNGLKLKERALFVLAQSRSDKSRGIVASYAKGSTSNPDLQLKSVEYLGTYGSKESRAVLGDIYASVSDVTVKRAVLRGFMIAQDKERLFNAAKTEQNPELRHEAIRWLGSLRADVELGQLYSAETNADNKEIIIQSMFQTGQSDKLLEIAKTEKDLKLRRGAIRGLGMMKREKGAEALVSLYGSETDKGIKSEIIRSLFMQNSAKQLVDVAKKETDPELKRECVRNLSMMKSKDATDYMVELLGK